eukprot:GDKH01028569.1.p1 GENE.GDKH01028569.1~~GDKH01028569.1.p1  ORF type:complete len:172 (+),score=19.76 GDKH01028569.1:157-672(+)
MKKIALLFVVAAMAAACGEKKGAAVTEAEGQTNTENTADVDPTVIDNPSTATEPTAAVDPATAPMITFEKDQLELKAITEGESVEVVYNFTNTGKSSLVLSAVEPTCGCTVTDDWPKEPIAPGAKGKIKAKYNSEGRGTGQITKSIMIKSNALAPDDIKEVKFTIQVNPKK